MDEEVVISMVDDLEQPPRLSERPPMHRQQKHNTWKGSSRSGIRDCLKPPTRISSQGALISNMHIIQSPGLSYAGHVTNEILAFWCLCPRDRRKGIFFGLDVAVLDVWWKREGVEGGDLLGLLLLVQGGGGGVLLGRGVVWRMDLLHYLLSDFPQTSVWPVIGLRVDHASCKMSNEGRCLCLGFMPAAFMGVFL